MLWTCFTPVCMMRMYVIGVGEKKTPEAFCNACDDFIYLEYLTSTKNDEQKNEKEKAQPAVSGKKKNITPAADADINEIHALLRIAYGKYVEDEDDYVNISSAGIYIKRVKPEFSPLAYGYSKLSELIKDYPQLYEIKRVSGDRRSSGYAYRCRSRSI